MINIVGAAIRISSLFPTVIIKTYNVKIIQLHTHRQKDTHTYSGGTYTDRHIDTDGKTHTYPSGTYTQTDTVTQKECHTHTHTQVVLTQTHRQTQWHRHNVIDTQFQTDTDRKTHTYPSGRGSC